MIEMTIPVPESSRGCNSIVAQRQGREVKIQMNIGGVPAAWIKFDLLQLETLIASLQEQERALTEALTVGAA